MPQCEPMRWKKCHELSCFHKYVLEMDKSQQNGSVKIWVEKKPSTLIDLTPYISAKTFDILTFISFFIIIRKFAIL